MSTFLLGTSEPQTKHFLQFFCFPLNKLGLQMKRFLSIVRTVKFVSTSLKKKKAKELLRCMIRVIQKLLYTANGTVYAMYKINNFIRKKAYNLLGKIKSIPSNIPFLWIVRNFQRWEI